MHKHIYDLERFGPQPWEDMDDSGETPIPPEASALEEAEHAINVAITCWIEALCQHEVGQDWLFAPGHMYASIHQDFEEYGGRSQKWLVLFYETMLFDEVDEQTPAEFGLRITRNLDPKGDVMVQSVYLTSLATLDQPAEEATYLRIVAAAQAHASGNSAMIALEVALGLATSSVH